MIGAESDQSVLAFSQRWSAKNRGTRQLRRTEHEQQVQQAVRRNNDRAARRRRVSSLTAIGAVVALGLSGCGLSGGIYALPLPGGADLGDNPLTLHLRMKNVYDLVPQASVKAADVPVGKVTKISLSHPVGGQWMADVEMQVNRDHAALPANATGELRQSSLLGEKFIDLFAPANPVGKLSDNATLEENPNYHHVEVEQVLGALSLLLNEGGLPQIRTIARELNSATSGNEQEIKTLLRQVNATAAHLDEHSADITAALDGLDRLSATLNAQKAQLVRAVDNLGPGLKVLTDQRAQLVKMLKSLQSLSHVAIDTVNKTRDDLLGDLRTLQPTLRSLNQAGDDLPNALQILLTFPFTDYASTTVRGDYANLYVNLDLNLDTVLTNLGRSRQNAIGQSVGNPLLKGILGGDKKPTASTSPQLPQGGESAVQQPSGSGTQPQPELPSDPDAQQGHSYSGGMGGIFGTLLNGGA